MNLLRSSLLVAAMVLPLAAGCGPETPTGSEPAGAQLTQAVGGQPGAAGTGGKVEVCHLPPGNPANAHTIVVGAPAVEAHLAHGDRVGSCEAPGEGGDGSSPDGGDETPPPEEVCAAEGTSCDPDHPCCAGLTCGAGNLCAPEVVIE
jgi:hypothetical protein